MIGKLTGHIDYIAADHLLINCGGVGYLVYCSSRTLASLPPAGEPVALYTELLVREDNLQLFGFLTPMEKEWHKLLISVQGVGAKAAMAIMGVLGQEGVSRAISLGDASAIKQAPGVGPKLAQRVVLELKNKAPDMVALGGLAKKPASIIAGNESTPLVETDNAPDNSAAQAAALSALTNLGYAPSEAAEAVMASPSTTESNIIRDALKSLAKNL